MGSPAFPRSLWMSPTTDSQGTSLVPFTLFRILWMTSAVAVNAGSGKMRLLEIDPMRKLDFSVITLVALLFLCVSSTVRQARAEAEKASYPVMAPLDAYLIADQD